MKETGYGARFAPDAKSARMKLTWVQPNGVFEAVQKPLDTVTISDLGVTASADIKVVRTDPPPQRQKGVIVKSAGELVEALRKKGLVS